MRPRINLRSTFLVLSLPLIWLGSFAATGSLSSELASAYEFLPVAVHAVHSANYSVDTSLTKMAPFEPEIMTDAMHDQGITPPATSLLPEPVIDTNEPSEEEDAPVVEEPNSSPPPENPDQGVVPQDPGQSGEDNSNKDKDEDSPGQSGEDHGGGNGDGGGKPDKPPKEDKPPK
jgi:hypothetical protein